MASGLIFSGLSVEEVLAIRAKALVSLQQGQFTSSSSVGEVSFGFTFPPGFTVQQVLEECTFFLRTADPATYGQRIIAKKSNFRTGYW